MSTEHELFKQAFETWGKSAQIDMMIEECSELIKALCKFKRNHNPSDTAALINDVCEEIADVKIMTGQMRYIFGAKDVGNWYKLKLTRLGGRLR
jgi:hypothetical protein